ncbi:MAG: exodeoxyribonuclease VII small subunit [Gemmatimonadetes bacterium]|nr:exodeoxyribonuclease VII small subunit [Gemmatimonadota bacterium]
MSFEDALGRLESIVQELERTDVPLDDALRLFEDGVAQVRAAGQTLQAVDAQVRRLSEDADGAFRLEAFPS